MVNPSWGLSQQPSSFEKSFGVGLQLGQSAKRAQAEGALSAYAMNPDDPEARKGLAQHAPRFAIQERANMDAREQEKQLKQLRRAALLGDQNAATELATMDNAAYNNATKEQREASDQADKMVAQALFQIESMPLEQRSAAWDSVARSAGADELIGTYGPDAVRVIAAKGGVSKALQELSNPKYMAIPEGGTLVNTRDPSAISQFGQQPQAQTEQGGGQPATYATPEQVATLKASMGEQAAMEYLQSRGIDAVEAVKNVGGKEYFQINGQWFEN